MSWLTDFYAKHPEYRRLRVAKRSAASIHFELEPNVYEAHFQIKPMHERTARGVWLPQSKLNHAVRLGHALIRDPRAALAFVASLPFGLTLTLQPDATAGLDTYIDEFAPTLNYGITTTLLAGLGTVAGRIRRSQIKYDVSSISNTAIVSSGVQTLNCSSELVTTDFTVSAFRGLTQWFEGSKNAATPSGTDGSTWNLRNDNGAVAWGSSTVGGLSGTDFASSATASTVITAPGAFTWDITVDVAAWVAGSATNNGIWMRNNSEGSSNSQKTFDSSDNATAGNRPQLVVVYTLPVQNMVRAPTWGTF